MSAAWRDLATRRADLLLRGGRLIDPTNNRDGIADVVIRNGRVIAIGTAAQELAPRRTIDVSGAIVTPGFIDMHVHVYEWVTNFGVPADAAGIQSGATTIVDQGSSGAWTFGGFKAFIAEPARTDVRAFVSINVAGALQGGMEGTTLHNPGMVHIDSLVRIAAEHPQIVRGIKCHWESGGLSHWGPTVLEKRRKPDVTPIFRFTCTRVSFSRSMRRTGRNRQRSWARWFSISSPATCSPTSIRACPTAS